MALLGASLSIPGAALAGPLPPEPPTPTLVRQHVLGPSSLRPQAIVDRMSPTGAITGRYPVSAPEAVTLRLRLHSS